MIQTTITKDIYHGDGATRRFEVTFDYNTKNNVKQIDLYTCTYTTEDGVTKYNNDVTEITSNYDFEVVNNVTYAVYPSDAAVSDGATPMATGTAIIIMRNTPNEQLSTGQYTSEKVEKQLDRITMVQQELQEQLNRTYKAPKYSDSVDETDFVTVAQNIDNINDVAENLSDINTVKNNLTDITTVATNISDVNTVGQNIEDVNDVSYHITDVSTISSNMSSVTDVADNIQAIIYAGENIADISAVADNLTDISTVADKATDVTTVASISTAVSKVADNESNVNMVSDNLANVNTVASNMNSVLAVSGDISNVNTVAGNTTNINTVAGISSNVTTVAGIASDITDVKNNATNINTVATSISNVNTVATDISNVNAAASNMSAIIAAPTAAQNAATSATNAQKWAEGTDSDVQPLGGTKSSKGWANRAQELVESIGTVMRYKGSVANYAALQAIQNPTLGDTYNVLDTGANYAWDGSAWDEIGSAVDLSAYRTAAQQDAIDATYLPLSGGTMTGNLYIKGSNNKLFGFKKTNSNTNIDIGWDWDNVDGSGAAFRSTDATSGQGPGNFILFARSGGNTSQLIGTPAGSLTWKTNEVITTANVDGTTIKATNNILSADATVMTAMTGATSSVAGVKGVVPAPSAGDDSKFLKGDGTWSTPTASSVWGSITGDLEDQTDLQNELDSKAPSVLLSHFWSDHIINEMSYLRGDTFSWQSGDVYTAVYQHLVDDIDGKTAQTETIGNYTITYYKADDKHKICLADQETTVLNIYNATGDAKYFILDTTNTRFKLPRWKHNKYQAKAPVIGNGMSLGLTDGTLNGGLHTIYAGNTGTLIGNPNQYGQNVGHADTTNTYLNINTAVGITSNPTKSGIEATLEADDMYLYFYVGTFTKTAYQETAGLNSSLFNGKVDLDGNNATFPHIVETSDPSILPNWYRVWSDGWCEQGGNSANWSNGTSKSVSLLKPYVDTNYTVFLQQNGTRGNAGESNTVVTSKSTTEFSASTGVINTCSLDWRAEGYIS